MKDYYKILGVDKSASNSEIKNSFRKLASKYHPDKNNNSKYSEDLFKDIVNAYNILSDSDKKAEYNFLLRHKLKNTYNSDRAEQYRWEQERQSTYSYNPVSNTNDKISSIYYKYKFWIFGIILLLIYFFSSIDNTETTLENQSTNRPQTGNIEF